MADSDESISISVQDKVSTGIADKFLLMAANAREAGTAIDALQKTLSALKSGDALSKMQSDMTRLTSAINSNNAASTKLNAAADKAALAQQKLATETQKTQVQMANVEAALQRAIAAETSASAAAQKLGSAQNTAAVSAAKLATAQQQTATAAAQTQIALANLATAQNNTAISAQRLATAQANTATAQTNANAAMTRSQTATQQLAAATTRATTAQTQGATAAQRLATEQQRTAVQTANASAAADRAALAALRLAEAQKRAAAETRGASTELASFVKQAALAVGVGFSASEIIKTADAYTVLQNKLQNVSESQGQVNLLTDRLFEIANETRTSVDATATAFTRFDRSLKGMGKSQEDTLRLTETINKALTNSGATAQESASALLQLSQAFNSGVLQGDEFRAVSENMPITLDYVAKVLGVTTGEVKKLGSQGKITAKVMYEAFTLMQQSVDATFAKTIPTVSQAFQVLENQVTQSLGKLNKSTGFTEALSAGIIKLSNNLDVLAVAAAGLGVAMLVAFGPTIVAAIETVTLAMKAFTLAVVTNPIGAAAVVIATAAAAVAVYGDEITVVAGKNATLKDEFRAVWSYVQEGASAAADAVKSAWDTAIDALNEKTNGWGEQFRDIGALILKYAKIYVNGFIATYVGGFAAMGVITDNFPDIVRYAFAQAVNFVSRAVSQIANLWLDGLGLINKGLAQMAPNAAAAIQEGLDGLRIELPQIDIGDKPKAAAEAAAAAFTNAFNKDYVGDAANAVMSRAEQIANTRKRNQRQGVGEGALRGEGVDTTVKAPDKDAIKRAAALAKVNLQLDNELDRMNMLAPAREQQQKYDQIEEQLASKKITLTQSESEAIKAKIKAIQEASYVQKAMDQIYEAAVGPQREYNAQMTAAADLLKRGAISQADYNKAVTLASETYKNTIDPMRQYNKDLTQQEQLLRLNADARSVEQQVMQQQNAMLANGTPLTEAQTAALRKRLTALQDLNKQAQADDQLRANTVGATQNLAAQQTALNKAMDAGTISHEYYANQMAQTNVAIATLQNQLGNGDMFSVFTAGVGQALQGFTTLAQGASDIIGNVMQTSIDGVSSAIGNAIAKGEDLRSSLQSVAQTIVADMIGALIKLGIQYAINAALGSTLAGTATAANVAMAATTAAAWAPAAAMASLASFGANAIPAEAALTTTTFTASALAMTGFRKGGYTGDSAVDQIAGVVHGQEYVVPADATARIGVGTLDRMVAGGDVQSVNNSVNNVGTAAAQATVGSKVIVNVMNYGSDQVTTQQSTTDDGTDQIDVIIGRVQEKMANDMRSRRGDMFDATQDAFGLQTNIANR